MELGIGLCLIGSLLFGYVVGGIPVGYLIGRLRGVDVRQFGSGRTGGTNVFRAAGPVAGALTILGDAAKALIAVGFARLIGSVFGTGELAASLAGIAVIAGHNWSPFLSFRGGAGGIAGLAVVTILTPWAGIPVLVCALLSVVVTRHASVGSITIAALSPLALAVAALAGGGGHLVHLLYGVAGGAMIIYALRPNLARLRAGTERRIGEKAPQ